MAGLMKIATNAAVVFSCGLQGIDAQCQMESQADGQHHVSALAEREPETGHICCANSSQIQSINCLL